MSKLLEILSQILPDSSKTSLRSWIREGRVFVDGEIVKKENTEILPEQKVTLGKRLHTLPVGVRIVHQDPHLVVIDKPCGLLSVATEFEKEETAHHILREHFRTRSVYIVHRLDQETSGLMMFALTEKARDLLKEGFASHKIERLYTAIVEGRVEPAQGRWESYLKEDANYFVHSSEDPTRGERAVTHYTVKAGNSKYSWLEISLETGKKNQIRVHCRVAGHSVVGDSKYGAATNPLKRLGLHAHTLIFNHPVTGRKMRFQSPTPDLFKKIFTGVAELNDGK